MPQFTQDGECSACELYERARTVGMETRAWDGHAGGATKPTALLCVGAYPGLKEDTEGKSFVGAAGLHMNGTYVRGAQLYKLADVYLANALRCFPRGRTSSASAEVKACRPHLVADIDLLYQHYEEVVVLACGSEAIESVLGKGCAIGRFPQGTQIELGEHRPVCFATYLPAILEPRRDPAKLPAIKDHLLLVRRWLRLGNLHPPCELPRTLRALKQMRLPRRLLGPLSLDIETYGAVEGLPEQRCFQPEQSLALDGCPRDQLVQTVALSWQTKQGGVAGCGYNVQQPAEKRALKRDLRLLQRQGPLSILSNNVQFDVAYLRAWDSAFAKMLCRRNGTQLIDLGVLSFLENDMRPERSLKSLVVLLGITDYYDEPVNLRKGERYRHAGDPRLLRYNLKDAVATLQCYEVLCDRIRDKYGSRTNKWNALCREWYSESLWLAFRESRNGIAFDIEGIKRVRTRLDGVMQRLRDATEGYVLTLDGPGSKTSQQELVDRLVGQYGPRGDGQREFDRQLLLTDKKREISTKDVNLTLIRDTPKMRRKEAREDRQLVVWLQRFRSLQKLQTSYVLPLLGEGKNIASQHLAGICHPRWYVTPGVYAEQQAKEGGQRQIRVSAQDPPAQTQPKMIAKLQRSRFEGGAQVSVDLSQIELRVPVMYSGDPVMLQAFQDGVSLHAKTATELAGRPITKQRDPVWYDAGKHANFLRVYGGDAPKLQQTLLLLTRETLPLSRCQQWITDDRQRYGVFYEWQQRLYGEATRTGRLEVPLLGVSRTFLGDVRQTYRSEILNFPVQALAAALAQSAQMAVDRELEERGMRSLTTHNIHDASYYDCPPEEIDETAEIALRWFRQPPLYARLIEAGLHECPLDAEAEIRYNE